MANLFFDYTPTELKATMDYAFEWLKRNAGCEDLFQKFKLSSIVPRSFLSLRTYTSKGRTYYKASKTINTQSFVFSVNGNGKTIEETLQKFLINYTIKYDSYFSNIIEPIQPSDTLFQACRKVTDQKLTRRNHIAASERIILDRLSILQRPELQKYMKKKISTLTQADFQQLSHLISQLKTLSTGNDLNAETKKQLWSMISQAYSQYAPRFGANTELLLSIKPPTAIKSSSGTSLQRSVLSNVQMVILDAVAKAHLPFGKKSYYFPNGTYITALLYSGLRKGEFAGLSRNNITITKFQANWTNAVLNIEQQIKPSDEIIKNDDNNIVYTKSQKPKRDNTLILTDTLKTKQSKRNVPCEPNITSILQEICKDKEAGRSNLQNYFVFSGQEKRIPSKPLRLEWSGQNHPLSFGKELAEQQFYNPARLSGTLDSIMRNCSLHPAFKAHNSLDEDIGAKRPYVFSIHDLRHTYISWQIRKGTPIEKIARLVGHSSLNTTYSYYRQEKDELERLQKEDSLVQSDFIYFFIRNELIACRNPGITLGEYAEIKKGFKLLDDDMRFLPLYAKTKHNQKYIAKHRFSYSDVYSFMPLPSSSKNSVCCTLPDGDNFFIYGFSEIPAILESIYPYAVVAEHTKAEILDLLGKIHIAIDLDEKPSALSSKELKGLCLQHADFILYNNEEYSNHFLQFVSLLEILEGLDTHSYKPTHLIDDNGILLYDGSVINLDSHTNIYTVYDDAFMEIITNSLIDVSSWMADYLYDSLSFF